MPRQKRSASVVTTSNIEGAFVESKEAVGSLCEKEESALPNTFQEWEELVVLVQRRGEDERMKSIAGNRATHNRYAARAFSAREQVPCAKSRYFREPGDFCFDLRETVEVLGGVAWAKVIRSVPTTDSSDSDSSSDSKSESESKAESLEGFEEVRVEVGSCDKLSISSTDRRDATFVNGSDVVGDKLIMEVFPNLADISITKCEYIYRNVHPFSHEIEGMDISGASMVYRIKERHNVLRILKGRQRDLIERDKIPDLPAVYANTIRKHFCVICMVYCCQQHPYLADVFASEKHWTMVDHSMLEEARNRAPPIGWNEEEWGLLLRGLAIFSGSDLNSLQKFIRTKTEADIGVCIKDMNLNVEPILMGKKRTLKNSTRHELRLLKQNKTEDTFRSSYIPCSHEGQCDPSVCFCPNSSHLCTKLCRCDPNCRFRYSGCRCKGRCSGNYCTCRSYDMECDPDLCDCCKSDDVQCHNQRLRHHQFKKVYLSKSKVPHAGWAIFLAEKANKDDLIMEYTGEYITDKVSDKRDQVYSRTKKTYVFRLTSDRDIDALRMGNEVRFSNHSSQPTCYVKAYFVSGRYHIGVFASRSLHEKEEITFDYDYTSDMRETYGITD